MTGISLSYNNRTVSINIPAMTTLVKAWTLVELAMVLWLINFALWNLSARTKAEWLILGWVIITTAIDLCLGLHSAYLMGLYPRQSRNCADCALIGLGFAGIILIAGLLFGSTRANSIDAFLFRKMGYIAAAFVQQLILQSYIFVRLEKLSVKGAVIMTTIVFASVHLPNPWLVVLVFLGGGVSCVIFQIHRNLYSIAIAHGIIGAAIAAFWQINMRVGAGF